MSQGHQVRLLVRSRDQVARSLSPLGVAQITGRHGRIVAMPAGVTLATGRLADLMQRLLPGRLPFSYESIWVGALQPHGDDSKTASELGIVSRDLRVTLQDTVRWLADQGHLTIKRPAEKG